MPNVPERPSLDGIDVGWAQEWERTGIYRFRGTGGRATVFSIDTPPPTVSGSLHVGHVFSFTHTDIVARFQRMSGQDVFYPMGWDDNGLPTERRVQNYFGVRCDPSLPYDPGFTAPEPAKGREQRPADISRRNFVELCEALTAEDEKAFERLWRRLGLSVDWSMTYTTIGERAQRVSQEAFLRLLVRGEAYQAEAPTLWDVGFRTAVAQAELEDREHPGAWCRIAFGGPDGGHVDIETTRPELLPACVALIAHPDDERYQPLFGGTATSPVFGVRIPILAHPAAERDRGAGIAMCCTFGDLTDVQWWRELKLPTRTIIGRDGRILADPPSGLDTPDGRAAYGRLAGATVHTARERVLAMLRESGDLDGAPRKTVRPVKFYEKGDKPLEIVSSRQWFIRSLAHQDALLRRGAALRWHPPYMKARYDNWVRGLNGDWLISRQRFFGVPFPLWYPLDENGEPRYDAPILPSTEALPVEPVLGCPARIHRGPARQAGRLRRRSRRHGHLGHVLADPADRVRVGGRPGTVRADLPHGSAPAGPRHHPDLAVLHHPAGRARIGHAALAERRTLRLDPGSRPEEDEQVQGQRRHAHRPVGAVRVRRRPLLGGQRQARHRHRLRPGPDEGRRLATKLVNASRFVLGFGEPDPGAVVTETLDQAMLAALDEVIAKATAALQDFEYTAALESTERFFWSFCDDYLELVKQRAYDDEGGAGRPVGPGLAAFRAVGPAAALRPVPAVLHRGSVVMVA